MPRISALLAATTVTAMLAACSDLGAPVGPEPTAAAEARADGGTRRVEILDACDPTSFNAVLGEGGCTRPGGLSFTSFIEELTAKGEVGAWRFAPASNVQAKVGGTLLAINRGGEAHTFTEVEEFGGGIVESLNTLSGNPGQAPECLTLDDDDFIAPGHTYSDEVEEAGTEHYQCCIHPWMRTTVAARE
jgi:plastocyanin